MLFILQVPSPLQSEMPEVCDLRPLTGFCSVWICGNTAPSNTHCNPWHFNAKGRCLSVLPSNCLLGWKGTVWWHTCVEEGLFFWNSHRTDDLVRQSRKIFMPLELTTIMNSWNGDQRTHKQTVKLGVACHWTQGPGKFTVPQLLVPVTGCSVRCP